ncbi:hypothetical protein CYMTET_11952 [Cymbomonas tetramitiformis]|uniref:Uncharacterized protein n=1 Tax=Cymbomonas tetramitiformis TaxID=36881 RepID=A0AAE0GLE4_9CHLO|nr:hypothetical protein CYMTET_11952 [Cymbomonas tetramitiformis]
MEVGRDTCHGINNTQATTWDAASQMSICKSASQSTIRKLGPLKRPRATCKPKIPKLSSRVEASCRVRCNVELLKS